MDKDVKKVEKKDVVSQKEKVNLEAKIVDIFKIMLGYNWHLMGTKKDF